MRISGTCASLAGLEKALQEETETEVELAISRILLIHGIILTIGGIPLIYLNDEVGKLNDYSYRDYPSKAGDSRWVHRLDTNWEQNCRRKDEKSIEGRIFQNLKGLISQRKSNPVFSGGTMQVINTESNHVLGYMRVHNSHKALILANFSEREQTIPANLLRLYGLNHSFKDLIMDEDIPIEDLKLEPYQFIITLIITKLTGKADL
jgi:amylosucrase